MRSIKALRKFIETHPGDPAAKVLADLVLALEDETAFQLSDIYDLDPKHFELAVNVIADWRLDRFYLGKAKLFDVSWQHRDLRAAASFEPS
jgi:hypothetical protein